MSNVIGYIIVKSWLKVGESRYNVTAIKTKHGRRVYVTDEVLGRKKGTVEYVEVYGGKDVQFFPRKDS